jgi:hypothetical protein
MPVEGPWLIPERSGISVGMSSANIVSIIGHAGPGDSGAPVMSESGFAVGLISGPPSSPVELSQGGVFVVSRIGPAVGRAEEVLGMTLMLVTS